MTDNHLVKLIVDDRKIETQHGKSLLQACLDNYVYIPNLCHIEEMERPSSSCRLCFVEVNGIDQPVTACTVKVKDEMTVFTNTPEVRRLQKRAFRLLLSVHQVQCKTCPANKQCELQRIAKFLKIGLKPGPLKVALKKDEIDQSHPFLDYYPNRCVLCGKCIEIDRIKNSQANLTFAKRGFNTTISFFGQNNRENISKKALIPCVDICPVKAIVFKTGNPES